MEKDLNEREGKGRTGEEIKSDKMLETDERKTMDKRKLKDAYKLITTVTVRSQVCHVQRFSMCQFFVAKNRVHINRCWSEFYCLYGEMATIYQCYLFHIFYIMYFNLNDAKLLDK